MPIVLHTVKNDLCLYFLKYLPHQGTSWAEVVMHTFLFNVDEVFFRGNAFRTELCVN
jgi:hypothetical protein